MDAIDRLEAQPWYQGPNELKQLQDELMQAMAAYQKACAEYGANPTPENRRACEDVGRYAEALAARLDKLTGKVSDEIPF